jgi:(p)ppGpp synthase/HD superfamily hydrolase
MEQLRKAIIFATTAHGDQLGEDGIPYIFHPLAVGAMSTSPAAQIVGVLHDVVEDTPATVELVREHFGDTIADAVEVITHRPDESYPDYLERVRQNDLAREVKINDLRHNLHVRPPIANVNRRTRLTERYTAALVQLRG